MAGERNRILKLTKFLSSKNIDVNIGTTKARGNKGFFLHNHNAYRIDISKNIEEEKIIPVLIHEYAHYVHYSFDKSLKSLDFAFGELNDDIKEELIKITVRDVPKEFASSLFETKKELSSEVKRLADKIKKEYPDFKISEKNKIIEKGFSPIQKYLLSYDRIKFLNKIYSSEKAEDLTNLNESQVAYIKLKSTQRRIKRINAKISRLNRYYNNPTELFARFAELFYTNNELAQKLAPIACKNFEQSAIPSFSELSDIIKTL